jgi:hypothetical protein
MLEDPPSFETALEIQGRDVKSSFLNALLGMAIGAPLGVCVNCAAPIAKGASTP